jgi:hypothetical protein
MLIPLDKEQWFKTLQMEKEMHEMIPHDYNRNAAN